MMKLSDEAINAKADRLGAILDGGFLRLYGGPQPAKPSITANDDAKLAELRFGNPAFGPAKSGLLTANPIAPDIKARATGKANWFRCFAADGATAVMDGSVGESGKDMNLICVDIQQNAEVLIDGFTYDENE